MLTVNFKSLNVDKFPPGKVHFGECCIVLPSSTTYADFCFANSLHNEHVLALTHFVLDPFGFRKLHPFYSYCQVATPQLSSLLATRLRLVNKFRGKLLDQFDRFSSGVWDGHGLTYI